MISWNNKFLSILFCLAFLFPSNSHADTQTFISNSTSTNGTSVGNNIDFLHDYYGNAINSQAISGEQCLSVAVHSGNEPTYSASTNGSVRTHTAAGSTTSIAYLFHPSTVTAAYEITSIVVTAVTGRGNRGLMDIDGVFISSQNASPGGYTVSASALDPLDPLSSAVFVAGATGNPISSSPMLMSCGFEADGAGMEAYQLFNANLTGKPIILPASLSSGFGVNVVVQSALGTAVNVYVSFIWKEVP